MDAKYTLDDIDKTLVHIAESLYSANHRTSDLPHKGDGVQPRDGVFAQRASEAFPAVRMVCTPMRSYAYSRQSPGVISEAIADDHVRAAISNRVHAEKNQHTSLKAYDELFAKLIQNSSAGTEDANAGSSNEHHAAGLEGTFTHVQLKHLLDVYESSIAKLADYVSICHLACVGLCSRLESLEQRARIAEHALERIKNRIQSSVDLRRS